MSSLSSNYFSFPFHNVFDIISPEELPCVTPVLESPVAHADVHSERAERLHQSSREKLDNPTIDDVTVTRSDDVEHNHSIPRELAKSPKGSHECVSHSSPVEDIEVHEVSVKSVQVQTDTIVEHVDVHSGARNSLVLPVVIKQPLLKMLACPRQFKRRKWLPVYNNKKFIPIRISSTV